MADVQYGKEDYITGSMNITNKIPAAKYRSTSNLAKQDNIADQTYDFVPIDKSDQYLESPTKVHNSKSISSKFINILGDINRGSFKITNCEC